MMKFQEKTKAFFAAKANRMILTLVIICLLGVTVYAAFFGAGYKKSVAVSSGFYFTSNVLSDPISTSGDMQWNDYSVIANNPATVLSLQVRNYNLEKQQNPLDITYRLECCLADATKTGYTYAVSDGKTTCTPTAAWQSLGEYTLSSDHLDFDSFTVSITTTLGQTDITKASAVRIKAVPISPNAMQKQIIGANIVLANHNDDYAVAGSFAFESVQSPDLNDYAGFLYQISTTGWIKSGATPKIRIIWDASLLELRANNPMVSANDVSESVEESGTRTKTLTLNGEMNMLFTLAFYRTEKWNNSGFQISADVIKNAVKVEVIN